MDIVKFAVMRPVAVLVGVLLVVLFGLVSLKKIPYQLSPNVTEPEIKPGAVKVACGSVGSLKVTV